MQPDVFIDLFQAFDVLLLPGENMSYLTSPRHPAILLSILQPQPEDKGPSLCGDPSGPPMKKHAQEAFPILAREDPSGVPRAYPQSFPDSILLSERGR
jgi:hypothetical protein